MNKFLLLITFSIFCFSTSIAQIAVKSFRILPTDQTARITNPVIDQNGEKCALIKVVTTETGFGWEGGMLGITKVEPKLGEFWVYIPHGAKKITIKHAQLGILRDYIYTEAIYEATVYEMVITTDEVTTIVKKREIKSVWLMINSNPSGADLYIDDVFVGQTPFQKKLKKQKYNFRLSKVKYQSTAGIVDLTDIEDKKLMEVNLKSDFGKINITSEPENGASVFLDDINISKITPCIINEIKSGTHRITLRKEWYEPITKEFTILAEEEKSFNIDLIQSFGELKITTNPKADIFIDNEMKGSGEYNCRLSPGIYSVKAQKAKHHDDTQSIEISVGDVKDIKLNLTPQYGILDIASTPWDANISIEDKNYGKTPITIKNLLVGTYTVKFTKEGYVPLTKTINIKENETEVINVELSSGKKITINSTPQGAKLYIDNEYIGTTPQTLSLSLESHSFKLKKDKYKDYQSTKTITNSNNGLIIEMEAIVLTFTDQRDGQTYKIVTIGKQVWMAENLNYKTKDSWCYENKNANCDKYGRLYNYDAAMKSCPSGWHLPSDDEWCTLTTYIDPTVNCNATGYSGADAGYKMKSTSNWHSNGNGSNAYGFSALPGGYRSSSGNFNYIEKNAYFWSSAEDGTNAWYRHLYYSYDRVGRSHYSRGHGFSVRCVKD